MGHWITALFVFELWTSKFNMNIDIIMFLIRRTMKTSLWKKVNCTNTLKKRKARGHQLLSMLLSKRRHHVQIIQGDLEAETPILWLPDAKSWLIEKHPDAGKDWGQEGKETNLGEMAEWHYWLSGYEFEQIQEIVKDREAWHAAVHGLQRDMTEWLNNHNK